MASQQERAKSEQKMDGGGKGRQERPEPVSHFTKKEKWNE